MGRVENTVNAKNPHNKITQSLTDFEKGYISAIIDGEGSILIHRRLRRSGSLNQPVYQILLRIYNSDRRLLERVNQIVDQGYVYLFHRKDYQKYTKDHYCYELQANGCRWLLPQIKDTLISKKAVAEIAIKTLNCIKLGRSHGRFISLTDWPKLEILFEQYRALRNK